MSILKVSIRQIKAARSLLAWSQEQLAAAADVSIPTIKRLEARDGPLGGRDETGTKYAAWSWLNDAQGSIFATPKHAPAALWLPPPTVGAGMRVSFSHGAAELR